MTEGLEARAARRRFVCKHEVEPVRGELREQVFHFALAANHMHGLRQGEDRFEDFIRHELGEGIHHAHMEAEGLRAGPLLHGVYHLAAERKNLFGEAQHNLPGVG